MCCGDHPDPDGPGRRHAKRHRGQRHRLRGIKFLGFNNPGDNDWSDNELGGALASGGNVYVKFNTADKGCAWNFKIEWADPGYPGVLWEGIDLCSIDELTLKYDRASDTTTAISK